MAKRSLIFWVHRHLDHSSVNYRIFKLGNLFNISELKAQHLQNEMKIPVWLFLDIETKTYIEEDSSYTNAPPVSFSALQLWMLGRGHRGEPDFISLGLLNAFIKVLCKCHIQTLRFVHLETELSKNSWLKDIIAQNPSVVPLPPGTCLNSSAWFSSMSVTLYSV